VILLDNRVVEEVSTRRLRVVKYRGSAHGANEYPFLIDQRGIGVLPITSAALDHPASSDSIPTGVAGLDVMFGAGGFFRGSSVLISGVAGTGKSTYSAAFVDAACRRGERALYFAFEEAPEQIMRNMRSAGVDLRTHLDNGLLRFEAARPSLYGLEMHLARMNRDITAFRPSVVVVDPISAFRGIQSEIHATLLRLADICKSGGVTAVFTSLSPVGDHSGTDDHAVSSLMDVWISLADLETNGERNRILYILKARGMSHSNQLREYRLTDKGVLLIEPYIGPEGVLTGSARLAQEAREREAAGRRLQAIQSRRRTLARKRRAMEREIAEMHAALEAEEQEIAVLISEDEAREDALVADRVVMAAKRGAAE
jgi:circadian clock protein KaiC